MFYFNGTGLDDITNERFGKMLMQSMAGSPASPFVVTDYVSIDPKNPGIVVPIDETFLNALACQYIADPKSKLAFEMYLKGDMYQNCFDVERKLGMKDMTSGMIDAEHMLHPDYRKWCRERAWMAEDLAAEYIGYDELMNLAIKYKDLYNKTSDPTQKLMHMLVITRLTDTFLPKANQAADNDANYRLLKGFLDNINKGEIYNNVAAAHAEPVSEPKGVTVGADIKKLAESVVGEYVTPGATVEKIIYLESEWHPFKNPKWPYDIIAYGLPCAVVTVENGKRYVQEVTLTKDAKTSKAFMQAGSDSMKRPLK